MLPIVESSKIIFNGQPYESIDQMPAAAREQYLQLAATLGDANRNGIPDSAEGRVTNVVSVNERIVFNGREYRSLDELPPEVRALVTKMPSLKPGEPGTQVRVESKALPPEVSITTFRGTGFTNRNGRATSISSRLLIGLLVAIILLLLALWLSGVRPETLLQ